MGSLVGAAHWGLRAYARASAFARWAGVAKRDRYHARGYAQEIQPPAVIRLKVAGENAAGLISLAASRFDSCRNSAQRAATEP